MTFEGMGNYCDMDQDEMTGDFEGQDLSFLSNVFDQLQESDTFWLRKGEGKNNKMEYRRIVLINIRIAEGESLSCKFPQDSLHKPL